MIVTKHDDNKKNIKESKASFFPQKYFKFLNLNNLITSRIKRLLMTDISHARNFTQSSNDISKLNKRMCNWNKN